MMKKSHFFILFILIASSAAYGQVDWRFGFEYNESEPNLLLGIDESSHDTLLSRLAEVSRSQQVRGGINVNGAGTWENMQSASGAALDFSNPDAWISRFQDDGFEYVWNLISNAKWAFQDNESCLSKQALYSECAPDSNHWDDWYDYVYAVVERYNGDGEDDMPGLQTPVRFYVLHQEVYFSGNGRGDIDEENGNGFWHDNMANLIRLHEVAYQAMQDADSGGVSRLVGSGGWFFDLYGDFPDYPQTFGPIVQQRMAGGGLLGATYLKGLDSLNLLLDRLGDDSKGKICDYVGWHPHMGWKSSDQSFKYLREHVPAKPIFVDDMWSAILTTVSRANGFTQFIGGDSIEGDLPNALIPDYQALITGLNAPDSAVIDWFNAKTAREAVKCFSVVFGEGVERACYSMVNDLNPANFIFWPISGPWRYSGMMGSVRDEYLPKPAARTMRLMIDLLHDFTSVAKLPVSNDPYTRVYRFERARGPACYVAWSETGWNPPDPAVPNGETVTFSVDSDSLRMISIITEPWVDDPDAQWIVSASNTLTLQLGFEPVFLEETRDPVLSDKSPGIHHSTAISIHPNPAGDSFTLLARLERPGDCKVVLRDLKGKEVSTTNVGELGTGIHQLDIPIRDIPGGLYLVEWILDQSRVHTLKVMKK